MDHIEKTLDILNRISGDQISSEATPVVVAELLEAQVRATLAVAEALNGILAHLEDRRKGSGDYGGYP